MTGKAEPRLIDWSGSRIGLTGRLLILVIFAVVPALVIQAWNEYDLRMAREADIRQQVVQTTKQFGEEKVSCAKVLVNCFSHWPSCTPLRPDSRARAIPFFQN